MAGSKASKYSYEVAIPLLGVESLWWILRANMNVVTAGRMAVIRISHFFLAGMVVLVSSHH